MSYVPLYPYTSLHRSLCLFFLPSLHPFVPLPTVEKARRYILTLLKPQQVMSYVPLYPYISLHRSLCLFFLPSIHSSFSPPSMPPWLHPSSFKTPAGFVLRTSGSLHLPPSFPLFVLPYLHPFAPLPTVDAPVATSLLF